MSFTIKQALASAVKQLDNISDSAHADAEILLGFILECDRSFFHTWPELTLEDAQALKFEELLQRRLNGEPIAHITGKRSFWDFDLKVTADTLIPRPETELLVELALEKIPSEQTSKILDLGTGTGAIALALAHERPSCKVIAIEQSQAAFEVAQHNQALLNLNNLQILSGNWFSTVNNQLFDLIVSNPPYIASNDPHLKQGDVRFEPETALISGEDGLNDIRHIVNQSQGYLTEKGWLMLEHGYDQASPVRQFMEQRNYKNVQQFKDIGYQFRVTIGQKP